MPHLRVTKAEMGEIEETEDFQLPPEEDVKVEEDIRMLTLFVIDIREDPCS